MLITWIWQNFQLKRWRHFWRAVMALKAAMALKVVVMALKAAMALKVVMEAVMALEMGVEAVMA